MASFKIRTHELANGIYELIRLKLVELGHIPDVALFDLTTDVGLTAYNVALEALTEHVIDVFNVGGPKSRGDKEDASIIIDRGLPKMATSGVGKHVDHDYNEATGKYDKTTPADIKYDVMFKLTYFCQHNYMADIIEDVLIQTIGERTYIQALNDDGEVSGDFWLIRDGEFDTSGKNFIERGKRFLARNIDLKGPKDEGEITPFDSEQFELEIAPQNTNKGYESINMFTCEIRALGGLLFDLVDISSIGDIWYNNRLFNLDLRNDGDLWFEIPTPSEIVDAYIDEYGDLYLLNGE